MTRRPSQHRKYITYCNAAIMQLQRESSHGQKKNVVSEICSGTQHRQSERPTDRHTRLITIPCYNTAVTAETSNKEEGRTDYNKWLCYGRGTARRACQLKFCNYKTSHLKTRVSGLSCGIICVILRLAVFVQYRSVTDTHRQTDGRTDTRRRHVSRLA